MEPPFTIEPSPLVEIPLIISDPPLNLRQCRQVLNMTQAQLADALNITVPWLCRLECGHEVPAKVLKLAITLLILTKTDADRSASRSRLRKIIERDGARIKHKTLTLSRNRERLSKRDEIRNKLL